MIDPTLALRLKRAWQALTPEQQAKFEAQLNTADQATRTYLATGIPPDVDGVRHEMLLARSVLDNNTAMQMQSAVLAIKQAQLGLFNHIDKNGVIWGFGQYQQLDYRWLEALASLWENLVAHNFFDFGTAPPPILEYGVDNFSLALVGDWGTGDWGGQPSQSPSQKIADQIRAMSPDITVHLGDVYYAGSSGEEVANMADLWPLGSWGSFALNSNHEMYPGGVNYFNKTLCNPGFQRQHERSCFAVETNSWIILGLDSAYYSDPYGLYMDGALYSSGGDPSKSPQVQLIQQVVGKGKPVLVLSHHNPLNEDGSIGSAPLRQQLSGACNGIGLLPKYWYYGHIHIGAVYNDGVANDGVRYRCIGHGGLPWGKASVLQNPKTVSWFEQTAIAGSPDHRVANGFAVLRFAGTTLKETIYTEDGIASWNLPLS